MKLHTYILILKSLVNFHAQILMLSLWQTIMISKKRVFRKVPWHKNQITATCKIKYMHEYAQNVCIDYDTTRIELRQLCLVVSLGLTYSCDT